MINTIILGLIATLNVMGYITLKNKIEGATSEMRTIRKENNENVQAIGYDINRLDEKIDKGNKDLKNRINDPANKINYIPMKLVLK